MGVPREVLFSPGVSTTAAGLQIETRTVACVQKLRCSFPLSHSFSLISSIGKSLYGWAVTKARIHELSVVKYFQDISEQSCLDCCEWHRKSAPCVSFWGDLNYILSLGGKYAQISKRKPCMKRWLSICASQEFWHQQVTQSISSITPADERGLPFDPQQSLSRTNHVPNTIPPGGQFATISVTGRRPLTEPVWFQEAQGTPRTSTKGKVKKKSGAAGSNPGLRRTVAREAGFTTVHHPSHFAQERYFFNPPVQLFIMLCVSS